MSLDRDRLNLVGRVTISDRDFAELEEVIALYKQTPSDVPLFMAEHFLELDIRNIEAERLRAVTEFVWIVWRDSGGVGSGTRWDQDPLVQNSYIGLMQQLFQDAGLRVPAARTLRRHLMVFRDEVDVIYRKHKR